VIQKREKLEKELYESRYVRYNIKDLIYDTFHYLDFYNRNYNRMCATKMNNYCERNGKQ